MIKYNSLLNEQYTMHSEGIPHKGLVELIHFPSSCGWGNPLGFTNQIVLCVFWRDARDICRLSDEAALFGSVRSSPPKCIDNEYCTALYCTIL